jgi:hypothetical protein
VSSLLGLGSGAAGALQPLARRPQASRQMRLLYLPVSPLLASRLLLGFQLG